MYENNNTAITDEMIESAKLLKKIIDQKNKIYNKYSSRLNDVKQFMDDTKKKVLEANYHKLKEK
jgi:ABC-type Fe3+-hydroxamate transport system substrate-binding protein